MTYAIKYFAHTQYFDKYDPSKMDYLTRKNVTTKQKSLLIMFKCHIVL